SVWCLDAYTGSVLWQYSTSGWVDSTPALWGDFVYVISRDGNLYCLKSRYAQEEDPQPVWVYNTGSNSCSSPVVVDGQVYFISGPPISGFPEGNLYVVNATDGTLIKKQKISQFGYSSPVVAGGKIYFATSDGVISCFDGNQVVWSVKTLDTFYLSAQGFLGNILYGYIGGTEHKVFAMDVSQAGKIIWKSPDLGNVATDGTSVGVSESSRIVVNVYPYGMDWAEGWNQYLSYAGMVWCLDLSNGTTLWQRSYATGVLPKDSPGFTSSPAIAGSSITYVGTINGDLFAFDIYTGTTVAKYQLDGGIVCSPAVSGGWVYVGTLNGKFYGIYSEKITSISAPDSGDLVISTTDVKLTLKSPSLTGYTIELGSGTSPYGWQTVFSTSSVPSGGLTDATVARLNLSAFSDGNYSLRLTANNDVSARAINSFSINNPPQPPTGVTARSNKAASLGVGSFIVNWNKSADDGAGDNDVQGYKIYKSTFSDSFMLTASLSAGSVEYVDNTSPLFTTYYFKLSAFDSLSYSEDSNVGAAINNPPAASSGVTVSDTEFDGGGSLTVKWNKSADDGSCEGDVKGYKVYKSTFAGGFMYRQSVSSGTVQYIENDCPVGTTYYFKVKSYDSLSDSADSNIASGSSLADGALVTPESGGSVSLVLPDGTTTEITAEPGSVASNVYFGVKVPDEASSHKDEGIPAEANPVNVIREFGGPPAGMKFLKPVTIKLPYKDTDVVNVKKENLINLRVYWWNEGKSAWTIVNTSEVRLEEKRVWARVDHFSLFRIMQYDPSKLPLISKENTYVYPNPARGDKLYFKFLLGNAASITVDVYNVAGELIWHRLENFDQGCAGLSKTIEWDISGIASGTYVFRIAAKSGNDEKVVTKKLAIIH
ncbi:MAG: PQQ-binding-like beta-propeller repeat protein, partial [Elusimicrobiota bacterium]